MFNGVLLEDFSITHEKNQSRAFESWTWKQHRTDEKEAPRGRQTSHYSSSPGTWGVKGWQQHQTVQVSMTSYSGIVYKKSVSRTHSGLCVTCTIKKPLLWIPRREKFSHFNLQQAFKNKGEKADTTLLCQTKQNEKGQLVWRLSRRGLCPFKQTSLEVLLHSEKLLPVLAHYQLCPACYRQEASL